MSSIMRIEDDLVPADGGSFSRSLSLSDLGRAIRRGRVLIFLTMISCEIVATLYLMMAEPRYPVDMVLAPQISDQVQGSSLGSALGGQGGSGGLAASLFGLSGGRVDTNFEKFRLLYISSQTATAVDQRFHLLPRLYPGWDEGTHSWKMPPLSLFNAPGRILRLVFRRPVWRIPTPADLASVLTGQISIVKDDENSFLTVTSISRNPRETEALLAALADAANEILRRQAQQQSAQQIHYLSTELNVVSNSDHRQVLTQLLLGQEQNLMLSRSNLPYAAQILNPPTTHYDQPRPGISVTLLFAGIIGLFAGIFLCFVREASAQGAGRIPRDIGEVLREKFARLKA
jgi:hypothetical protein